MSTTIIRIHDGKDELIHGYADNGGTMECIESTIS